MSLNNYSIRKITEQDLEQILLWRNSERIRSCMFTNHVISLEEHLQWFQLLQGSSSSQALIVEYLARPIGVINISGIYSLNKCCTWGFYLGETDVPPKSGLALGYLGLDYIFGVLGIRKLCSEVLTSNENSLRYHEKLGFIKEGQLNQHLYRNGSFEDIALFALFKDGWESLKQEIINQIEGVVR